MATPDLEGKVVLVTGAARGQGREHALALARAGASIAALDICADQPVPSYPLATRAELAAVVAEIEDLDRRALELVADVRSASQVAAAVARTLQSFGRLDIVVNNAAIAGSGPFWELTEEQWDAVVDTDLKGVWLVSKYATPHLIARPGGRIVNISSTAGVKGMANFAHYTAAKHGVVGLTRAMAVELAPYGVTVNAILPGAVASPMLDGLAEELGVTPADLHRVFLHQQLVEEVIQPSEVTAALLWLVSDAARHVTGHCLAVDGGWLVK
ncbi:MAG: mycofactocin-coupled SDR family oxidoreductase [Sphaerobacter sp.]|nr:mycofactocin-coupled SDR family oxidoreductase [Sphaerobacter sp.]